MWTFFEPLYVKDRIDGATNIATTVMGDDHCPEASLGSKSGDE